jgi:tRNA A-37 threonylcarbamoyl transferase component Bud32
LREAVTESPKHLRRRICAVCGDPQPEGANACPRDGSTMFSSASLMLDTVARPEELLGARLGDYEVIEVIGDGGMGIVYRGLQPVIQKKVAIKVLRPDVANDKTLVRRFLAEAKAVNAISHRNIVDIFTLGTLPDGRPYIVMELLDGLPLDKYLRSTAPLSPKETVDLLLEITSPLGAAHAAGIIHRDLKPSNVFLVKQPDGARYLKLLDFGLAKWHFDGHSAQTSANLVTGTPDYMSPEQARGLDVTPKSDLYALGVIAFEMLTGNVPFRGATPMDVMMQHVMTPPPDMPGCPKDLAVIVMGLMAKKPEERLAPTEKLRDALKQASLRNDIVSAPAAAAVAPPPKVSVQMPQAAAKRGWAVPVSLTVTVLAIAVSVAVWTLRPREPQPVVVAPPPPTQPKVLAPSPSPKAEPPVEIAEAAPVVPAPVAEPARPAAPAHAVRPAAPAGATPDALAARMNRLEARLRKRTEPGEEPDPSALVLLKKLRLSLATSRTPAEHKEIEKSLDDWEHTFLP